MHLAIMGCPEGTPSLSLKVKGNVIGVQLIIMTERIFFFHDYISNKIIIIGI